MSQKAHVTSHSMTEVSYLSRLGLLSVSEMPLFLGCGPLLPLPPLLCLRGGAIAAFANLTVGRTGGLHCGDRGSLTLQVTLIGSGVIEQESSGVWAPGRGRQQSATLNLIVNIAVVPHCLCLQTLQHGALTIRATRLH